jgi:Asp-tRNA(Asn)/Glu-tRNA(Gln) amidotransferase A subunit family amidase
MSPSDVSPSSEIPLARLADLIARRVVSSREVVDACPARIAAVNPVLNAVVQLRAEAALAEAEAADRDLAHGRVRGPLHGVPFTVGVQIAAAPWREDLALAAAASVERMLGGWSAPSIRVGDAVAS